MPKPALHERPYLQFNFLVTLGGSDTSSPDAGFQECSGLGMEVTVGAYRTGNEKPKGIRKLAGLQKAAGVTLKRGVIGSQKLRQWLAETRAGGAAATHTVTIQLQSEDHTAIVQTWKLTGARIAKQGGPPLDAKGKIATDRAPP
jgi:phage tail-like protein